MKKIFKSKFLTLLYAHLQSQKDFLRETPIYKATLYDQETL